MSRAIISIQSFDDFHQQRIHDKLRIYKNVYQLGTSLIAIGFTLNLIFAAASVFSDSIYLVIGIDIIVNLFAVTGILVCSTLPPDEISIENVPYYIKFSITFALVLVNFTNVVYPPYGTVLVFVYLSFIIYSEYFSKDNKWSTSSKFSIYSCIDIVLNRGAIEIVYGVIGPTSFKRLSLLPGSAWILLWNKESSLMIGLIRVVVGILFLAILCRKSLYHSTDPLISTFQQQYLTYAVYTNLLVLGMDMVIACSGLLHDGSDDSTNAVLNLIRGLMIIISVLLVLILSPRWVFGVMARYFENNSKRREEDGALLADIVASTVVDVGDVWFIKRSQEDLRFAVTNPRRFFMKGYVNEVFVCELEVKVDINEDKDSSWDIKFNGVNVVEPPTSRQYDYQLFRYELPRHMLNRKELILWSKQNLRYLDWNNFTDILLLKSPRELESNEEKMAAFNVSIPCSMTRLKIDYFVSHSWEDNAICKCTCLREFSDHFMSKRGRYPRLWLDKVCINQANPMIGLQVLPIIIGACEKFLLVLGPSYMERLWCVWELYTLFSFCREEQALERIEVIFLNDPAADQIGDKDEILSDFNLDNAHCFDPNEEQKLRLLICGIGADRFTQNIRNLSKKFNNNFHRSNSSSFSTSISNSYGILLRLDSR